MWHGEPTWAAGSGRGRDRMSPTATAWLPPCWSSSQRHRNSVWEVALDPAGATNFEFSETVTVPAAGGEHHFEMKAVDANGVEVETGFHVEVE